MSIYFYGCISLDGYLATKDHNLDWLYETGNTEETSYDEFYALMDITIMGRRTFQEIEKCANPETVYPTTKNYVFTHNELNCNGFEAVNESPIDFIKKQDPNSNIWIIGGNTILAPLLKNDLIDHLIIQVAPVLLGAGIPLFTQKEGIHRYTLAKVNQYGQFAELVLNRQNTSLAEEIPS